MFFTIAESQGDGLMFYNKTIELWTSSTGTLDSKGIMQKGEKQFVKSIDCDVQPYSKSHLYRDYGFDEEVQYRVFCGCDFSMKNGSKVKYKDGFYKVVRIVEWDDYIEVMITNE